MLDATTAPSPACSTAIGPVFAKVLGPQWHDLGEVVRRHYFLRPRSCDAITVHGTMGEVWHSGVGRLLLPLARIAGALVPYKGRDVPVAVHYRSDERDATIHWDRVFRFPGRRPFHFRSRMEQTGPGEVIEFVRFGIGMRLAVSAENEALVFRGRGYVWRLFGVDVPVPASLLLGEALVIERPTGGRDRFDMEMRLHHPVFGDLFRYDGAFTLGEEAPAAAP